MIIPTLMHESRKKIKNQYNASFDFGAQGA